MGHPLIDEFCRAQQLHPEFFRRCQRVFREEVQSQLDERERLLTENADLRAQLEVCHAQSRSESAGDVPQYSDGDAGGPTAETGRRHRLRQGAGQRKEERQEETVKG